MKTALRRLLALFVLACVGALFHLRSTHATSPSLRNVRRNFADGQRTDGEANSTLGFGAILAVSKPGSQRQERLLFAANLTDIDVTIPEQPAWSDSDVETIRAKDGSKMSRGSALAWLGHLHALRWFLNSTLETVVIVEDDVDWDIHLRSTQVPAVSSAFRRLLSTPQTPYSNYPLTPQPLGAESPLNEIPHLRPHQHHNHQHHHQHHLQHHKHHQHHHHHKRDVLASYHSNSEVDDAEDSDYDYDEFDDPQSASQDYWGPPAKWEILYLGHCGDFFPAHRLRNNLAHATVPDATLPPVARLHARTQKFWRDLRLPAQQRLVHRSVWPLCTFAYAVHRASAERILAEFDKEGSTGTPAYDVRILEACRDLGWLCYSVNPELFHHNDGKSEIAAINDGSGGEARQKKEEPGEDDDWEWEDEGRAPNIACGARSEEFFTRDQETLSYLRREISRRGECLIDRMEESSREWP